MRRVLRIAANKPQASVSTAQVSAAVPSSGLASVDNSQGASVATAQLSADLGAVFDQVDLDDNLKTTFGQLVRDLDDEASTYDNTGISDEGAYLQWQCSQDEAQLVSAAWNCANGAYHLDVDIANTMNCSFQADEVVKPSLEGTIKALTSTLVTPTEKENGKDNELLPVLVIAIRGSASKMDQIVNANEGPKPASHFINPRISSSLELMAHAGFLNCAEALSDTVLRITRKYALSLGLEKSHVLFTGHSAGGAVASLLFLRHIYNPALALNTKFSCITFGAPPSITPAVDLSKLQSPSYKIFALDIINEFDLVSRADKPYVSSLVNLLRSKHGQPPLAPAPAPEHSSEGPLSNPPVEENISAAENGKHLPQPKTWPVPKLFYHHAGLRIVFLMRLNSEDMVQLRAIEVPSEKLESLLFCRLSVHRKSCYGERVQLLEQGQFNGRGHWEDG